MSLPRGCALCPSCCGRGIPNAVMISNVEQLSGKHQANVKLSTLDCRRDAVTMPLVSSSGAILLIWP